MAKKIRIKSTGIIYAPGFFRWIREAVAPFDGKHAKQLLRGLGFGPADAKFLADAKNKVQITIEDEDLILEFTTPNLKKSTA